MDEQNTCPVCGEKAAFAPYAGGHYELNCARCGRFSISKLACDFFPTDKHYNRANLSGWIRENQECLLFPEDLKRLAQLPTPAVADKGDKLLRWMAKAYPKAGAKIEVLCKPLASHIKQHLPDLYELQLLKQPFFKPELFSFSWSQDHEELLYILVKYLEKEMQYIEDIGAAVFRITPKGWSHIDSLRQGNPQSQIGFIAMWFDKSVDSVHSAIEIAIQNAGYVPLRIDRKEHNNKIDDEIVAGIRRSKFLVADFTGHRGGVYFETGFATGLGLPVIWLCRKDELEKTHFDARQYNFIVWEADKLAELSKALQNRIEATIGRGPLTGNAVT
jgi:hypothetical protein